MPVRHAGRVRSVEVDAAGRRRPPSCCCCCPQLALALDPERTRPDERLRTRPRARCRRRPLGRTRHVDPDPSAALLAGRARDDRLRARRDGDDARRAAAADRLRARHRRGHGRAADQRVRARHRRRDRPRDRADPRAAASPRARGGARRARPRERRDRLRADGRRRPRVPVRRRGLLGRRSGACSPCTAAASARPAARVVHSRSSRRALPSASRSGPRSAPGSARPSTGAGRSAASA